MKTEDAPEPRLVLPANGRHKRLVSAARQAGYSYDLHKRTKCIVHLNSLGKRGRAGRSAHGAVHGGAVPGKHALHCRMEKRYRHTSKQLRDSNVRLVSGRMAAPLYAQQ